MDALLQEDTDRYRGALEATGGALGDIEPISRFHEVYQGTVDASYAAAVVGLETEAFLEKISGEYRVTERRFVGARQSEWEYETGHLDIKFPRIYCFALDFPELVDKPPVVPDPDRLPGGFVHIPDPNLRAAIAEATW